MNAEAVGHVTIGTDLDQQASFIERDIYMCVGLDKPNAWFVDWATTRMELDLHWLVLLLSPEGSREFGMTRCLTWSYIWSPQQEDK